jgi:hypothetical protein
MRTGNLIVFSPGFRRVWKLKFDAIPLFALVLIFFAAVTVVGTASYFAPLLAVDNDEHSYRLVVENRTLTLENQTLESRVEHLGERARELEQQTSRIAAELEEQQSE